MCNQATKTVLPVSRSFRIRDVIERFLRKKNFVLQTTYGDVYAAKVTELTGDVVELDETEQVLVALKRRKVISGRRLVTLLGEHQREVRGNPQRLSEQPVK